MAFFWSLVPLSGVTVYIGEGRDIYLDLFPEDPKILFSVKISQGFEWDEQQ